MSARISALACFLTISAIPALAGRYDLLTGIDAGLSPGLQRSVAPGGFFFDGDRLAGTSDRGPQIAFVGVGNPLFQPNQFGATSFLYRRGSVPLFPSGRMALMGIEYLGGPLLDLDGDLLNGSRSLVPVSGQTPVAIPGSNSYLGLTFDLQAGSVVLNNIDFTGTNEGSPGFQAQTATVIITRSNTSPSGQLGPSINPAIDTRSGSVTPFAGIGGSLTSVYQISNFGYELWEDSIDPTSSSASTLGTFQFLGSLHGWLVRRDSTGSFPTLAGKGMGTTSWPLVDVAQVGNTFNTANGLAGGTATITTGNASDDFTLAGNGGVSMTDFGGDIGAYFDAVIVPALPFRSREFVYLESAGFGINNSFDPVFTDTVGYDTVLIAARPTCRGDLNYDDVVNESDLGLLLAAWQSGPNGDLDNDGDTDESDLGLLLANWLNTCP
ncbi:MAG: hypothetical protein U1D55_10890 [Phycisphaerae bacterium]